MKTKSLLRAVIVAASFLTVLPLRAGLPRDFPGITVTACESNGVAPGLIFLTVSETSTNTGYYSMILQNDGTPVWYQAEPQPPLDLKVLPNGYIHNGVSYHTLSWTGGWDVSHQVLDGNDNLVETVQAGNGYPAESHEFQILPNGDAVVLSYYQSYMDLSQYMPGAYPNALVAGAVIQELDAQRHVVWQWRSWDHYDFGAYYGPVMSQFVRGVYPVVDSFHINSVNLDTDGNYLISNFQVDVEKLNRQTGAVMWRLGGWGNQFKFVGENPLVAMAHFSGHDFTRLPNGDVMIFCNADQQATRSSVVYEYKLDETNKVATLVWSYTPATPHYSWHAGSAQRLANGDTFIGWGGGDIIPGIGGTTNAQVPACTEVNAAGQVVYEMWFNDPRVCSYRAFRFPWPSTNADPVSLTLFAAGNSYQFGDTGVTMLVSSGAGGYNPPVVTVRREPYAPVYPLFNGAPPAVLPLRVQLQDVAATVNATLSFDATSFNFSNPSNLTVYYRPTIGQGLFLPQPTSYSPATGQLTTTVAMTDHSQQLGEFIFGYPDVTQIPYPPTLNAVENYGPQPIEVIEPLKAATNQMDTVNQTLPIWLSWSPNGFAASYDLQIGTTPDFAAPEVDESSLIDAYYIWSNALPETTYYYRVDTANAGGIGSWATNSFQTDGPFVRLTLPNGGEALRRGAACFVQWADDLVENVNVDLYKSGVFFGNLATNVASRGAIKWAIPASLATGSDYSCKVASVAQPSINACSAAPFSIVDPPSINLDAIVSNPDGSVAFTVTAPGAPTATVFFSTNLPQWQLLQHIPVSNGSATFTDWPGPARFYQVSVP